MSDGKKVKTLWLEFQGRHTSQAYYKLGIMSPEYQGYVKMGEMDLPLWRDFSDILLEE